MPLKKYKIFIKAAETQNLTKAADELSYTQPTVSYTIKCLEDELGVQLIVRGKSGITLTPEGEKLLPYAKALVESEGDFVEHAMALRGAGKDLRGQ